MTLRGTGAVPVDTATVGIGAAIVAIASGMASVVNAVLIIVLILAMLLDMLSRMGRIYRSQGLERFSADKFVGGLVGKLMRLGVVMLAALLDIAFSVLFPLSGDTITRLTPTTKGALAYLLVGEGVSVLNNIRHSEGDDAIPALVVRALDRLRRGGAEPPARRHYDVEAMEAERELKVAATKTPTAGADDGTE